MAAILSFLQPPLPLPCPRCPGMALLLVHGCCNLLRAPLLCCGRGQTTSACSWCLGCGGAGVLSWGPAGWRACQGWGHPALPSLGANTAHASRTPRFLGTLLARGHLSRWRRACGKELLRPRGQSPARSVAGVLRGESVPSASGQGMGLARAFLCLVPSLCQGKGDAGEALQCGDRPRTLHFPFTSGLSQLGMGSRLTPGSRLFSHPLGGCHHDAAPGAGGPSTAAQRLWAASAWLGLPLLPLSCLSPGGRWERQMARGRHELPRLGSRLWRWEPGAGSGLLALPVHGPGVLLGTGPGGSRAGDERVLGAAGSWTDLGPLPRGSHGDSGGLACPSCPPGWP